MIKIAPNEKWVKERLSQYVGTLWGGWHLLIPFIDTVKKLDMRERVINTPSQEMITQDNAVVTVDAVIFAQIMDPVKAVYEIQEPFLAITNLSVTTLRSIIGTMTLDEVLWERSKINTKVQLDLTAETAKWWLNINKIEIQRIDPPVELMEAMNQQKIAQQEKRAQILKAEGLKEAAIREAEGIKEKQVLEATGKAESIRIVAEAQAAEIQVVSESLNKNFTDKAVLRQQLRTLEEAMKSNTKYVVDTEIIQSLIKSVKL